jgi:hypothetical protein
LFAQSVTVDNIRRALGQHTTCPRKFPKAVQVKLTGAPAHFDRRIST